MGVRLTLPQGPFRDSAPGIQRSWVDTRSPARFPAKTPTTANPSVGDIPDPRKTQFNFDGSSPLQYILRKQVYCRGRGGSPDQMHDSQNAAGRAES